MFGIIGEELVLQQNRIMKLSLTCVMIRVLIIPSTPMDLISNIASCVDSLLTAVNFVRQEALFVQVVLGIMI